MVYSTQYCENIEDDSWFKTVESVGLNFLLGEGGGGDFTAVRCSVVCVPIPSINISLTFSWYPL